VQGVIQQGPHATEPPEHGLLHESKRKGGFMHTRFVRWLVLAGCIAAVTLAGAAVISGPIVGFFARIAEGPAEPTPSADSTAIAQPRAPSAPALAKAPSPPLCAADGARSAEEREPLDLSRTPRDLTREASRRASEALRGALLDEERFPELAACVAAGEECDALESKALAAVLTWPLHDDLFRGVYGLAQLEQAWGRDALLDHLIEEVEEASSRSEEPADRIAALALLDAMQATEAPPLGAAVYARLGSRPAPEAALLVAQYERAPLGDDAVVDEPSTSMKMDFSRATSPSPWWLPRSFAVAPPARCSSRRSRAERTRPAVSRRSRLSLAGIPVRRHSFSMRSRPPSSSTER
jgi:hypothetical protein